MAFDIVVPEVGESITEVIIAQWHKEIGQWVELDENVVALDTDKVSVDVPAPAAGFLREVLVTVDGVANVGDVIGRIEEGDRPDAAAPPAQAKPAPAKPAPAKPSPPADKPAAEKKVMPAAARAAAVAGIDPAQVEGSGAGGRVLKEDVLRAAAKSATAPTPTPRSEERRVGKECRSRWSPYH